LYFLFDPHPFSLCDEKMSVPQKPAIYRKQLEESLVEIEQYLQKTEESAEAVSPDKGLGRLSRMEAMQDQQLILEARRRKKMQKIAVQAALQRIENGQFGTCIFLWKCNRFRSTGSGSRIQYLCQLLRFFITTGNHRDFSYP